MGTRYFNSDGTVRSCTARGPVGGVQQYNLAQWVGSESWHTPTSEMQSTLRSTQLICATEPTPKLAGVKTAPAIDGRSHSRPPSPRKLADIRGHDIFADGERSVAVRPVSRRKADELAGSVLKDIKAAKPKAPSPRIDSARKMDNLCSVAFTSGKVELPVAPVSCRKLHHLAGNLPFPTAPVQLRTMKKMKPRMGEPLGIHEPLQWDPSCKVVEGPRACSRPSSGRHPVGGKCQVVLG